MGTEFDCAIHLLAASQSRKEFPCCGLDERGYSKESIVGRSGSMGEPTDECCLESVRRKMQMQEDIFRKQVDRSVVQSPVILVWTRLSMIPTGGIPISLQVRELHRLYSMQKKLMGELKKDMGQNRFSSPMKSPNANSIHWPHKMHDASGCAFHLHRLNDDRGSQDRSACSSREAMRIPIGIDLEIRPSKGNDSITYGGLSCPNFDAPAKREVNCINDELDEESDVELTLSIGRRSSRRQSKSCSSRKEHSSASITLVQGDDCNSNTSNMGGSSRISGPEKCKFNRGMHQGSPKFSI